MRLRTLPLLVACMAFVPSGQCLAANPPQGSSTSVRESSPTHVLGFAAGENFDQAEALTRALKKAIEHSTNQKLGSGEFSLEVLTAALGCPEKPDQACLKKIAAKISSPRFLWGTLETSGQRVDAELHLHTDDANDKKVKFSYQAGIAGSTDGELLTVAANAVSQLIGPLRYRVVVQSSRADGFVLVDGKEGGTLVDGEATLDVPAEEHQFRLKPSGEQASSSQVLAEHQAKTQITEVTRVRLDPTEGGRIGAKSTPTASGSERQSDTSSQQPKQETVAFEDKPHTGNAQRTWGYITLAAGGVLLVGGAAAAADLYLLNHKDNFERYRAGLSSSQDACSEADRNTVVPGAMTPKGVRELCNNASMLEIGQIVLLAGGVVAAGTGLTLLLTSKSEPRQAATTFVPRVMVGRNRADFGLSVRF